MNTGLFAFLLAVIYVSLPAAEKVEIVSDMYTEEILRPECFEDVKDCYELRLVDQAHHLPVTTDYDTVKRYIIFNIHYPHADLDVFPAEKKVLFMMEPIRIPVEEAQAYSRVYTWDDDMIDNELYFKYYFPDLAPMIDQLPPFEDKKLATMIVRNWSAKHRRPIVEYFSQKPKGDFEFYGSPFPGLDYSWCYKGRIPGVNCGMEKINVLKNYRFCFCFENSVDLNGYISEKIFPCFAAGCVPIYWGAPNIAEYIPSDCYIDYRDFNDHETLYDYIKNMPVDVHEQYLNNIRRFLGSGQAQLFSQENFSHTLYEAVVQ